MGNARTARSVHFVTFCAMAFDKSGSGFITAESLVSAQQHPLQRLKFTIKCKTIYIHKKIPQTSIFKHA
eukprot:649606-Amphidinium_carterae.1